MKTKILFIFLVLLPILVAFAQTNSSEPATVEFQHPPKVKWKYKTTQPIVSTPLVHEGVIFFGGMDSVFYAINLENGEVKWKKKSFGPIKSSPAVFNGLLYYYDGFGMLQARNATSGDLIWRFLTGGSVLGERTYDFADYYQSSPVVNDGIVYFGSGDNNIYALDAEKGDLIWKYRTNDIVHNTPIVAKGKVIIGSYDGYLYALDSKTGNLIWKFKSVGHKYFEKGEIQGSPVIIDNLVYVGARDYNLYAIDLYSGYSHWNKTYPKGWATAVTPWDSLIFVGTSDDRLFVAMDAKSGTVRWEVPVGFNIFGQASFSSSMVYFGTLMGKIFGVSLNDHKVEWTFETDGYQTNKLKYFDSNDQYRSDIQNILKKPDDVLTLYYDVGAIFSKPVLAQNKLLITSSDGTLYCLE